MRLSAIVALNNAGVVTDDGGAAPSGTGGVGGIVELMSALVPVVNTSTCSAVGGAGATVGEAGRVTIDGIIQ